MKIDKVLLIVFSGLVLLSCEEKEDISVRKISEIIVGDHSNMTINTYNKKLIGTYNVPEYFSIDIDNDSIDDIQFKSRLWGSPAVGNHPMSEISTLSDNVQIYGYQNNDTTYVNRDIDTSTYTETDCSIALYKTYNYTCHQIDENDSILKITSTNKLSPLDSGDVINTDETYYSDTFVFYNDGYTDPATGLSIINDTAIYIVKNYYNDCDDYPMDEIKYLGVRFKNDSILGWVKLKVYNGYKILILESGINK